jgi:hypothetical protein
MVSFALKTFDLCLRPKERLSLTIKERPMRRPPMRCFSARINELSHGKASLVLVLKIPSLSGSISKRSLKIGLENYFQRANSGNTLGYD